MFGTQKKVSQHPEWEKYWDLDSKIQALKEEQESHKQALIDIAEKDELWEGKTAHFKGGNKIRKTESIKLIKPDGFSKIDFLAENAEYSKIELDEAKLKKAIEKGEPVLEDFGFGLELSESYKFERS